MRLRVVKTNGLGVLAAIFSYPRSCRALFLVMMSLIVYKTNYLYFREGLKPGMDIQPHMTAALAVMDTLATDAAVSPSLR